MSETIDPITWLKDFFSTRKRIEFNPHTAELEFENSSIRLPLQAQTAWKRKGDKGFYTVGSIWLLIKMKDAKISDIMREYKKLNIQNVSISDKKEIIDYFTGVVHESNQIDTTIRAATLIRKTDIRCGRVLQAQEYQMRRRDKKSERKLSDKEDKVIGE